MPSNSELSLLTKCLDLDDVKVINFGFIPEFGLVISVENKCPIVECPKCQSKTGRVNGSSGFAVEDV
jgi:Zn finger protein HypA/HybF involved in hydrogenase expression